MKHTLILLTALRLAPLAGLHAADAPAAQTALVTVHPEKPGVKIPADFLGFSCEKKILSIECFHPGNSVVLNLYRNLGGGVLRIGANEVESTYWSRTGTNPPSGMKTIGYNLKPVTIGPLSVDNLYAFAKQSGWRVIHGLNFGANDPAMAADEAAYALQVGGPLVLAFEVGNEPNLYHEGSTRPPNYRYPQYRAEIENYNRVILARLPKAPLAGPATTWAFGWYKEYLGDFKSRLALATAHTYVLSAKEENPLAPRFATVENLLSAKSAQNTEKNWLPQLEAASAAHLPFRIGECNSASGGGKRGVSDAFASALWSTDFLFDVAEHGGAGVNFHGGFGSRPGYSPFCFIRNRYSANPIYYSMLLFHQAARGQVVPVECQTPANLTAHAVLGDDHKLRVVLINKDLTNSVVATIMPGTPRTKAEMIRLRAPSVTSTEGVTLAGSAVAEDGTWKPQPGTPVPCANGKCEVSLPAASAALLTLE
ncbi:MAG: glycosyl hydrolase family 79 C-terminal domain-containing protein [Verrucomicrobiota bacterium]